MGYLYFYFDNVLLGYILECIVLFYVYGNLFMVVGFVFFFYENWKKKDYFCYDIKYKVENV